MTNSPKYELQLAINDYWKEVGGLNMLPGTNRSSDRFVRASFYINAIPQTADAKIAVPSVLSVMRNVSVPFGITTPDKPHISSTRWRSVSDQKNKVYYFESTLTPNLFWLDLKKIDFSPNAGIKKLTDKRRNICRRCHKGFERQQRICISFPDTGNVAQPLHIAPQ